MTVTKSWKVYGRYGHRLAMSFYPSMRDDFSKDDNIRIIEVDNSDITGTNAYSIVRITRNTEEECEREFDGQLCDGIFENCCTGWIEEIEQKEVI